MISNFIGIKNKLSYFCKTHYFYLLNIFENKSLKFEKHPDLFLCALSAKFIPVG